MHRNVPCPEFAGAKKKCVVLAASPQQQPGHGMAEILGWWPHDLTWDLVHGEHAEIGRHWRIEVFNFRCVKPLDIRLLVVDLFKKYCIDEKTE